MAAWCLWCSLKNTWILSCHLAAIPQQPTHDHGAASFSQTDSGDRSFLDLFPFLPFMKVSSHLTTQPENNVKLYNFDKWTPKNYTMTTPYHFRAASMQKPHRLFVISLRRLWRLHDDCTISVPVCSGLSPSTKSPCKKLHEACIQHTLWPIAIYDARKIVRKIIDK